VTVQTGGIKSSLPGVKVSRSDSANRWNKVIITRG